MEKILAILLNNSNLLKTHIPHIGNKKQTLENEKRVSKSLFKHLQIWGNCTDWVLTFTVAEVVTASSRSWINFGYLVDMMFSKHCSLVFWCFFSLHMSHSWLPENEGETKKIGLSAAALATKANKWNFTAQWNTFDSISHAFGFLLQVHNLCTTHTSGYRKLQPFAM